MISEVTVSADDLSTAWLRTTLALAAQPGHKAFHAVTRIRDVGSEVEEIRLGADTLLNTLDLPGVETIANTIFPQAIAAQTPGVDALAERYVNLYPILKRLDPHGNGKGTYFLRLVGYPGEKGKVNQLALIIRALHVELSTRGPKSARYEASIEVPSDGDAIGPAEEVAERDRSMDGRPVFVPGQDTSSMAFPCLSFLSFQLDGNRLHAVAHYRSQYLVQRGYGNYLGLSRLMRYVAAQTNLRPASLTIVAGRAHGDKLNLARIGNLTELLARSEPA